MHDTPPTTAHDSTHNDAERFERRQLAKDRDARSTPTVTVDDSEARDRVSALIDDGTVDVVPEDGLLVHTPSGRRFESNRALVLFNRGWNAHAHGSTEAE